MAKKKSKKKTSSKKARKSTPKAKSRKSSSPKRTKKAGSTNLYQRLREKHESGRRGSTSEDYWSPPAPRRKGQKSVSVVRLLAFESEEGNEDIFVRTAKWWDLGGTKGPVAAHSDKEQDPIAALKPLLDQEDWKKLCKHFRAQFLANLIVVSEDGKKLGDWKIGQFSPSTYDQILDFFPGGDKADQVGMSKEPVSLTKGCDFKITRERTGNRPVDTKYTVVPLKVSVCKEEVEPVDLEKRLPKVDLDQLRELAGLVAQEYGIEEE